MTPAQAQNSFQKIRTISYVQICNQMKTAGLYPFKPEAFTVGIVFSNQRTRSLSDHFLKHYDKEPVDLLLDRYAEDNKLQRLLLVPNLVQVRFWNSRFSVDFVQFQFYGCVLNSTVVYCDFFGMQLRLLRWNRPFVVGAKATWRGQTTFAALLNAQRRTSTVLKQIQAFTAAEIDWLRHRRKQTNFTRAVESLQHCSCTRHGKEQNIHSKMTCSQHIGAFSSNRQKNQGFKEYKGSSTFEP